MVGAGSQFVSVGDPALRTSCLTWVRSPLSCILSNASGTTATMSRAIADGRQPKNSSPTNASAPSFLLTWADSPDADELGLRAFGLPPLSTPMMESIRPNVVYPARFDSFRGHGVEHPLAMDAERVSSGPDWRWAGLRGYPAGFPLSGQPRSARKVAPAFSG
jgi:hypothetical protein